MVITLLPILFAQVIAPPIQPGPIRTPGINVKERLNQEPVVIQNQQKENEDLLQPTAEFPRKLLTDIPQIDGELPYTETDLKEIFGECLQVNDISQRLNRCASELMSKLVIDGFLNTRIVVDLDSQPSRLIILEGRLVEIRVFGPDESLNSEVFERLTPFKLGMLNLNKLNLTLNNLQSSPYVETIQAQLSRHGSQTTASSLTIQVFPKVSKWESSFSVSNAGSTTTGEAQFLAFTTKRDLIKPKDQFLTYIETNQDNKFKFGSFNQSISYTYPISDALRLTGALGYSIAKPHRERSNSVKIFHNQFQYSTELSWKFYESKTSRWESFISLIGSRSNLYLDGRYPPKNLFSDLTRRPTNSYLKGGFQGSGSGVHYGWQGQIYALQALESFIPKNQIDAYSKLGVNIRNSNAIGGQAEIFYRLSPKLAIQLKGVGQWAIDKLPNVMNFSIGSDQGIIGLPSEFVSGNSGLIGTMEVPFLISSNEDHRLNLIPSIAMGSVHSEFDRHSISDLIATYGIRLNYTLLDPNTSIDIGWVGVNNSVNTMESRWGDSLLGRGVFTRIVYSF